jgi:hypothetical protein
MYEILVVGGPYDGRIFRIEKNDYQLNRVIENFQWEGQGFIMCMVKEITRVATL